MLTCLFIYIYGLYLFVFYLNLYACIYAHTHHLSIIILHTDTHTCYRKVVEGGLTWLGHIRFLLITDKRPITLQDKIPRPPCLNVFTYMRETYLES